MSWKEVKVEEQRLNFIISYIEGKFSLASLCQEYGISRKTGYKWLERFFEKGEEGLKDLSRAPHSHPHELSQEVVEAIIEIKETFRKFGAKKIHAKLQEIKPNLYLPSINGIGNVLSRFGLVVPRRYRKKVPGTAPLAHCVDANNVWAYDFKGWFLTGDGAKCEPLTITDSHTRYLIKCTSLTRKTATNVWSVFESAFREYGLPLRVRSDNGPPFAAPGAGRLSSLSVLFIKAGVVPEWIAPGKPQENGRHERFHLTLKNETASPPAATLKRQEKSFQRFQSYYNNDRPHEALLQKTPASLYRPSERIWDGILRSPEYVEDYILRKVMKCGCIAWYGKNVFISETLYGEYVGIIERDNDHFQVFYGPIELGWIDANKKFQKDK
jgi:putative transposase